MRLPQVLRRWLVPPTQRSLVDMIDGWLRERTEDVLVVEHRFSRCELRQRERTIELVVPAATLLLRSAAVENAAPELTFDPETGGFHRSYPRTGGNPTVFTLAREVQAVVDALFDRPEGGSPVLTREPRGLPNPSELKTPGGFTLAMRKLAQSRTDADRHLVYQAFMGASLLLPLRIPEDGKASAAVVPAEDGDPVGTVWATFTNWEDAQRWRRSAGPQTKPWAMVSGVQVLALAARANLGSLLINPGGSVGGEFFRHELDRMARAAHVAT